MAKPLCLGSGGTVLPSDYVATNIPYDATLDWGAIYGGGQADIKLAEPDAPNDPSLGYPPTIPQSKGTGTAAALSVGVGILLGAMGIFAWRNYRGTQNKKRYRRR
jgi:hypothetical protein